MSTHGTAVITGASSGIGAEFARQLGARGYDLLLIARRKPKLDALAAEIIANHAVRVEVFESDLAVPAQAERAAARVAELSDASHLVNSAGFGTTGRFQRVEAGKHLDMIQVHLAASVRLTHAVLPKMIERKRGALVYVASTGAFVPLPGNVTYCASKAFLVSFTESLEPEVAPAGVRVQVLCPGFTHTEFHNTPEYARFNRGSLPAMMWQSADQVVAASLRGLDRGQRVVIPGAVNRMLVGMGSLPLIGRPLRMTFVRRMMFGRKR
jgi:short-subunit dehydrogenase